MLCLICLLFQHRLKKQTRQQLEAYVCERVRLLGRAFGLACRIAEGENHRTIVKLSHGFDETFCERASDCRCAYRNRRSKVVANLFETDQVLVFLDVFRLVRRKSDAGAILKRREVSVGVKTNLMHSD